MQFLQLDESHWISLDQYSAKVRRTDRSLTPLLIMNEQRVCVGQMPPIPGADVDAISDGVAAWTILVLGRRQQLQEPRYDTVLPILAGAVSRMSNEPIPSPS